MNDERDTSSRRLVLRARAVGHQYQPTWWCLRDVDLAFRPGETVGVVGPNGAGKTTLLRALGGLIRPTAGEVTLADRPLAAFSRRRLARHLGYLPQDVQGAFAYSVEEVVAQGRYPRNATLGLIGAHDRRVIERVMVATHVDAFAQRPLAELSGGERQRALLASVLAQETEFLLLDEPTAALDLHHQVEVFRLIADLARRRGLGVILITHDLNLAARYCDRMVLLDEGRVARDGAPGDVMERDILEAVYRTRLRVERNPATGAPMVVVLGDAPDETEATPWRS